MTRWPWWRQPTQQIPDLTGPDSSYMNGRGAYAPGAAPIEQPKPPGPPVPLAPVAAIAQVNSDATRATMRRWEQTRREHQNLTMREHADAIDDAVRQIADHWLLRDEDPR